MTASENTPPKLEPAYKCFMCERTPAVRDTDWDLKSLRFIYGDNDLREDFKCMKLCDRHVKFCRARILELEALAPKEEPAPTLPPRPEPPPAVKPSTQMKADRHFSEPTGRQPGEEG